MAGLRTFDAFPKTEEQHVRKSSKGGYTSILTYVFLIFIAWSEFGSFFGGYVDEQYGVSKDLREAVQINMDMFVHMPCQWLDVIVQDHTGDRKLVREELKMESIPFFLPFGTAVNERNEIASLGLDEVLAEAIPGQFRDQIDFGSEDESKEFNGCHVFGTITVNMVKGDLIIIPRSQSVRDFGRMPPDAINLSHVINEFSFGDFYPYIDNPLDRSARITAEHTTSFHYHTSVVPTIFQKLGAEVNTNQYSLSETKHETPPSGLRVPAIIFSYSFEALTITIRDERISFWQFIVRLVAILSFIVYIMTWAFTLLDMILVLLLGPKWSLRYQRDGRQKTGILE
ncbi:Erv41p [Lachancea thermotolerans CBS 6340]|uniref:Endoplasmic reticulum-Golgi intermediate compartment protein n=1 Tax=Lachancea thermotolerans (strain ATCC 56472 / CBS 6340 / NRRL Y-8284) TaxID=559295 RepID=C5DFM5_LACTC|nr:KLTH0D16324p [Lachancea thermotolerans CBS 6340]CAR22980.1 KLTH0D16324p [Lachancea thermotolerans CBS 6340]